MCTAERTAGSARPRYGLLRDGLLRGGLLRDGLLRDVLAIAMAAFLVGVSFGAITVSAGLPGWSVPALSVLVFAGGAQFMAVGLVTGGNPVAAVLAGLLINARHLPFGFAVADAIGTGWPARLVGSHLMTDEAVAFTMAQPGQARRRRAYWLTGVVLFIVWNGGSLIGAALGGAAGDPGALGLDAAFPAGLLALLLPSLRDRDTRLVASLGAGVAVLTTPLLPAGLPVLLALAGLGVLALPSRWRHSASRGGGTDGTSVDRAGHPAGAGHGADSGNESLEDRC